MCHLRGLLMLKLNRGDQAKACFMEALVLDVKCFEAFQQLVDGQMMSPDEGAHIRSLGVHILTQAKSGSSYKVLRTRSSPRKMLISCV